MGVLEVLIAIVLLIPIAAFYLLKWIFVGIACVVRYITLTVKKPKLEEIAADFDEVNRMDGHEFEYFTASVLRNNGFSNVVVTKASGDYGVDITASKDKTRWAFQCKCYQSTLGLKPIQEVYAGAKKYNASKAVVVTNSYFSKNAKALADELGVELWDRDVLGEMMIKNKRTAEQSKAKSANTDTPVVKKSAKQSAKIAQPINCKKVEGFEMATKIGAGKYIFGEDIPMGRYNLKAISGSGQLKIQSGVAKPDEEVPFDWMDFGVEEYCAKTYNGLSLPEGWWFALDDSIVAEISKAKMLQID